jgi:hypothetical protein
MKKGSRLLRAPALTFALVLWLGGTAGAALASGNDDTYVVYSGTAVAQRGDQFLYHEQHVLRYRDGKIAERVVLYTCRDGSPFARKEVVYVDAFSPDFVLEDASNGMREGIRSAGKSREVFFRGDSSAPEKTSPLPAVHGLVADAGFDEFVRAHWNDLLAGHSLEMDFLVPSRLDDINFKVQHVRSDETDGVPVEVFRLKLAGILGWVAPSIDVYYSTKDRTLVRYVGLSDLRDRSNQNFNALIDFRPADRKPGDEQALLNAKRAPLGPCK